MLDNLKFGENKLEAGEARFYIKVTTPKKNEYFLGPYTNQNAQRSALQELNRKHRNYGDLRETLVEEITSDERNIETIAVDKMLTELEAELIEIESGREKIQ